MCRAVSITRSDLGTAASQQAALHSRDYQLDASKNLAESRAF
jgi:hypothetical protein